MQTKYWFDLIVTLLVILLIGATFATSTPIEEYEKPAQTLIIAPKKVMDSIKLGDADSIFVVDTAKVLPNNATNVAETQGIVYEVVLDDTHWHPPDSSPHVGLNMLMGLCEYPLFAYVTVLLESGYPDKKSALAINAFNNFGMRPPQSRCYAATEKDLQLFPKGIRSILKLAHKNKCGERVLKYPGNWAIYTSKEQSAKCFCQYQKDFVVPRKPKTAKQYIAILEEIGYFTDDEAAGYKRKWLQILDNITTSQTIN